MISFNVLGDCVSRDILTPIVDRGGVQVLQYVSFTNPISLVSQKSDIYLKAEDLEKYDIANFHKRCFLLDYNKEGMDYLFYQKSDYLLIDILDARMPMLKKDRHYITESVFVVKNRPSLNNQFDVENYNDVNPFCDISYEQWYIAIQTLCNKILKRYSPSQIIINKHFMCDKFSINGRIERFPQLRNEEIDYINPIPFFNSDIGIKKTNDLAVKLFENMVDLLPGCHVIEFPDNIVADGKHQWGLNPLHYMPLYYEYGSKALEIICEGNNREKENDKLKELHKIFSEKNELILKESKITELSNQLLWTRNALIFSKSLIYDMFKENKFIDWLEQCAESKKKVAILKANDTAGQIFSVALQKYNIQVVFKSACYGFWELSADEIELCQKADIIISADVHGTAPIEYENLKAVRIADLIK